MCLTFVFGALLEFALVNYASRNDQHRAAVIKQRKQWEAEQAAATEMAMEMAKNAAAANTQRTPNNKQPITALVSYLHQNYIWDRESNVIYFYPNFLTGSK